MARYVWTNPTKSSKVICYLSLNIPIHKIKGIDTLLPEIPMLKKSCNLIGQEHFCNITCEPEFFQIIWFVQENRNVQCFKLLPEKCNEKKLWKVKKPSIFVPNLNPFCHFRANNKFSWKPNFITFFSFLKFLLLCRISEKKQRTVSNNSYRRRGWRTHSHKSARTTMNSLVPLDEGPITNLCKFNCRILSLLSLF